MRSRAVLVFAYPGRSADTLHVTDIYATHDRIFGPVLSPDCRGGGWTTAHRTANESGQTRKWPDAWSSSKRSPEGVPTVVAKMKYKVDYDHSHRQEFLECFWSVFGVFSAVAVVLVWWQLSEVKSVGVFAHLTFLCWCKCARHFRKPMGQMFIYSVDNLKPNL